MATEPPYFTEARAAGRLAITEIPKLELDAYIANYRGKTQIHRLHHIGTSSTQLYLEALKAAIAAAKRGKDVELYKTVSAALFQIVPDDPDATQDSAWITKTASEVNKETSRLELELKGYRNNLIKESIRMGCEDLGHHYHMIGDLANAVKSYSREREYVQTPAHLVNMHMHIVHVSIDQGNWLNVQSTISKIRNLQLRADEAEKLNPKLSIAMGLVNLASGNFKEAASCFLGTDPRIIGRADNPNDPEAFNEILSPNDVAVYGGLCALASMDRIELQQKVLDNASFRNYLELEPHIRRAISFFVSSKYSSCLAILKSYRADYLLDYYLWRHIDEIYFRVRSKAIVQYFIPFSSVTFEELAKAFSADEETIERTLVEMIGIGSLDARIDLEYRLLVARQVDARSELHRDALEIAEDYERTAHLRLLRMETINAGLEVKSPKSQDGILSQAGEVFGTEGSKGKGKGGIRGFFA
ncbi:hypothetical protein MMC30_000300 [Trapelia coarctata]|nr:hypothetical protein [Trapelia coarctata]